MSQTFAVTGSLVGMILLTLSSCDLLQPNPGQERDWTGGKEILLPEEGSIPDSIKALYRTDAARLALRDVHADSVAKTTLVEIPSGLIDLYYNGLIHVYQSSEIPQRDFIEHLHTFRHPELHSLVVSVDSTLDWTQAWAAGQRLTGNAVIDTLMERYSLDLDRYYHWPWYHAAVLRSPFPINIFALAGLFAGAQGVVYAEPNGVMGDGNDITADIEEEFVRYTFSFGFGDCPAGCIGRRYWEFHVSYDGTVVFVRSYGSQLPKQRR